MTTTTVRTSSPRVCLPGYPEASSRFEWAVTLASLWVIAGLYLDGWAHNNIPETIEGFFTPWHMLLYSGLAASIVVLGIPYLINLRKGYSGLRSLPPAYMLSLLGAAVFVAAGILDFLWHAAFGFEEDVEALVSPSHLSLALGGVMMISGPLRMAWGRASNERISLPALLSLFAVLSVFTFFTQFSNAFAHPNMLVGEVPIGFPHGDTYLWDVSSISYVLIPTTLLVGFILAAILRWKLPVGSLTFLIAGNSSLMFVMAWGHSRDQWPVLIAAVLGGVLADVLMLVLKPSHGRVKALRGFSALMPAGLYAFYFLSLVLTDGIWWNSNMWLGMIFFSAVLGFGLSWLAVPPHSASASIGETTLTGDA